MTDLVGKRVRVKDSAWLPPIAQAFVGEEGVVAAPMLDKAAWIVGFDGGEAWYYESELEVLDPSNPSKEEG